MNWTGTNGTIRYNPSSPELNSLNFFALNKILLIRNEIAENQKRNVIDYTVRKVIICRDRNNKHFEHLP